MVSFGMTEASLDAHQIAAAQTELRAALGLPPETFPVSSFISMVSDEIEQLRAQGRSDADIAALIQTAGGVTVSARDVSQHYVFFFLIGRPD